MFTVIMFALCFLLPRDPVAEDDGNLVSHLPFRYLISQGVDVDAQTTDGNSVVWIAANNGCIK